MNRHRLDLFFWMHLIVVIVMWSSPFWISWKIIVGLVLLYYLQLLIFGDCILIRKGGKRKKREITIYLQILENLGFNPNRRFIVILSDYVFPWIIVGLALVIQLFQSKPL